MIRVVLSVLVMIFMTTVAYAETCVECHTKITPNINVMLLPSDSPFLFPLEQLGPTEPTTTTTTPTP